MHHRHGNQPDKFRDRPRVENTRHARLTSGSYVILNPGSYYTLVLCFAGFVLGVAILAVAPVWNVYLSPFKSSPNGLLSGGTKSLTPEFQLTALIAW
jgi:hypothetical protein